MGSRFSLDGSMIPRRVQRMFDQRAEKRVNSPSCTAVLVLRGKSHVVPVANVSDSGAMIVFSGVPHIGDKVSLQLIDRDIMQAEVRWVRDGRVGLAFTQILG
ncbi:MAG: PilZ domain-containing protein [Sphingomicrobium sp.]